MDYRSGADRGGCVGPYPINAWTDSRYRRVAGANPEASIREWGDRSRDLPADAGGPEGLSKEGREPWKRGVKDSRSDSWGRRSGRRSMGDQGFS